MVNVLLDPTSTTYIFHLARYFTSSKYELDKSKYLFVISFVISSLKHLTSVTQRKHFQIKSFLFQLWRSSHYTFKMFINHKFVKLFIILPIRGAETGSGPQKCDAAFVCLDRGASAQGVGAIP